MNNLLKGLIYDGKKILSESGIKNAVDEARLIIKKTLKKNELEFLLSIGPAYKVLILYPYDFFSVTMQHLGDFFININKYSSFFDVL